MRWCNWRWSCRFTQVNSLRRFRNTTIKAGQVQQTCLLWRHELRERAQFHGITKLSQLSHPRLLKIFSIAERLCGHIVTAQARGNSMDRTPKKGVFCMKWDSDGELSFHDTNALIKRLANVERSRRAMLDHHKRRRWHSRGNGDLLPNQPLAS